MKPKFAAFTAAGLALSSCAQSPLSEAAPIRVAPSGDLASPHEPVEQGLGSETGEDSERKCVSGISSGSPSTFGSGITSIYKYRVVSEKSDGGEFLKRAHRAGFGVVPVLLGSEQAIFVTSAGPLHSVQQLITEAETACSLQQPGIIELVDFQRNSDGN